jgi:beta-glucosidase/6-phospho-beta-glucosidase/beta-galactosidase
MTPEPDFFWGVATSGYQSEGGYNGEGEPANNWAWAEKEGTVSRSGGAVNFWEKAEEDFERCRALGLNSFRLSLEWARIQPGTVLPENGNQMVPPPRDAVAMARYVEILVAARRAGLEPLVTLHHFTQPAWLGIDAWLKPSTVDLFVEHVRATLREVRVGMEKAGEKPPRWFITINEPNLLAMCHYMYALFPSGPHHGLDPTIVCLSHLMQAHVRAYDVIHEELAEVSPMVSFNNYCSDVYWLDQAWVDLFCHAAKGRKGDGLCNALFEEARLFDQAFEEFELPMHRGFRFYLGQIFKAVHRLVADGFWQHRGFGRLLDLLEKRDRPALDYIAYDYYDPFIAHALRWPKWNDGLDGHKSTWQKQMDAFTSKWWDWKVFPEGLEFFSTHMNRHGLPLLIAENGMAHRRLPNNEGFEREDEMTRSDYVREHVRMVRRLRGRGVNLCGYMHWSLFDNYEWGTYAPRFGLYSIDYARSLDRLAVDPLGDNPSATYAAEIAASRAAKVSI